MASHDVPRESGASTATPAWSAAGPIRRSIPAPACGRAVRRLPRPVGCAENRRARLNATAASETPATVTNRRRVMREPKESLSFNVEADLRT